MTSSNENKLNSGSNGRYAIVKKLAFDVLVAREGKYKTDDPEYLNKILLLWYDFNWSDDYFTFLALNPVGNGPVTGAEIMGLSFRDPETPNLTYLIGIEKSDMMEPSDFKNITIPETTWAVFYSKGKPFPEIFNYIFGEWFPSTGYQLAKAPILNVFLPINPGMDYEIWVPITDKLNEIPLIRKREDWGKSRGFPNEFIDERIMRVGHYSGGFETLFPDRVRNIKASHQISPLKTRIREDLSYAWGTSTRNVSDYLESWPATGLLIARKGEIWIEKYRFDRKPNMRLSSWSMAKSVTSLLLGICMDMRLVGSLDDTADMYVEKLKGTLHGSVSLRDLSNMSSGADILHERDNAVIYPQGFFEPESDLESIVLKWDKTLDPPGTRFNYNELCAFTIGMVIREVTKMGMAEFCQKELWQPMGAEADAVWLTDSKGKEFNCVFFSARLRDWGRLGQLVAQNGFMNGRQIVSKDWIDQCSSWSEKDQQAYYGKPRPNNGYKTFFWHPREDGSWMMMLGAQGQVTLIDRNTQTVLVQTAVDEQGVWMRELLEIFKAATQL